MKYDVYGIGNAIMDYEIKATEKFLQTFNVEKGLMTLVDEDRQIELVAGVFGQIKKRQSGGSVANSMIALAQFGGKGFYSCKVANDEDGVHYMQEMDELGVDTNLSELPDGTTGKCLVMVTPDAGRTMNTHLGITADLSVNEIDEEALSQAKFIYIEGYLVSSPTGILAIRKVKELAKKHGVKIAYTFSDPAMVKFFNDKSHEAVSGGIDLLFANEEEAMTFTGKSNEEEAFEALKQFAKNFVMTRSEKGAWIFNGENRVEITGHAVEAIDTTGAGDMFAGAFLYGMTNGLTHKEAGELASLASAKVVTQFGPRLENDVAAALIS
ncbi:MAG: adenosine kinase [Cytophagales bacterium]|nr:adenosine kinase [Cytophagales bacterium]